MMEEAGGMTPRLPRTPRHSRAGSTPTLQFNAVKILNALSYNPAMRPLLLQAGAVDALHANFERMIHTTGGVHYVITCSYEYLWTLRAAMKLVGQDEVSVMTDELHMRGIRWVLEALTASLAGKGFPHPKAAAPTPAKYIQDIAALAVSDANAKILAQLGALDLISRPLLGKWDESTKLNMESDPTEHAVMLEHVCGIITALSFVDGAMEQIMGNSELLTMVGKIATTNLAEAKGGAIVAASDDPSCAAAMQRACKEAKLLLFHLQAEETVKTSLQLDAKHLSEESSDEDEISGGHIMLSYCWGPKNTQTGTHENQELVKHIREDLEERGFKTWMDVLQLQGSTLNAMADAVERASSVVICVTKHYKESSACRMEADYAYQLQKRIIFLKCEDYKPDGWLGMFTRLFLACFLTCSLVRAALGMLLGSKLWYNFYDPNIFYDEMNHWVTKNLEPPAAKTANKVKRTEARRRSVEQASARRGSLAGNPAAAAAAAAAASNTAAEGGADSPTLSSPVVGGRAASPPLGHAPSAFGMQSPLGLQQASLASGGVVESALPELFALVTKSIESANEGRAVAEQARLAAEQRASDLELRLREAHEGRVAALVERLSCLQAENTALKLNLEQQQQQQADEGGGSSSILSGDARHEEGSEEAAQVQQWLVSLKLERYSQAIIAEQGYDALEYLQAATPEELETLCTVTSMKTPHAQKFKRAVAAGLMPEED